MRALLFCLLFLAACQRAPADAPPPKSWCREQSFDGTRFTVCDPEGGRLMLFAAGPNERPLRSFSEIARIIPADKIAFGMNAGMFGEDGRPIGLAIDSAGQAHKINLRRGGGNFHLKPNGVFIVRADGSAAIFVSEKLPRFADPVRLATQSGPMLVIDGKLHPTFEPDGQSRLVRNGVGVTRSGRPLFVISEDPVSFGKFARFFRDGLKTPDALYLDGSVSSLWDPANGRQDAHVSLGPILIALKPGVSAPGRGGRAKS